MRPRRLEIEGFTSFRERTIVDFEDTSLFVFSGPMGAGKSSIIDAIGFALYGSVARLNRMMVAAVISQGLNEAKIRLDFQLAGHDYTAVRVVRRSKTGGATTPEAQLWQGEKLLAQDADALSSQVEALLGLNFDQFTKCVVLPQGDFADLLHAKPADRQELLVRLLDIGLYRRIGERARNRAATADAERGLLQRRLENDLRDITLETFDEQAKRVAALAELVELLDADERALAEVIKALQEHAAAGEQAGQRLGLLEAVRVPPGVTDLVGKMLKARGSVEAARARAEQVTAEVEALDEARKALPDPAGLQVTIDNHRQRAALAARIAEAEKALTEADAQLSAAVQRSEAAGAASEAAVAERDRLVRADSAYHASQGLKAGDVCPVCGDILTDTPTLDPPGGLAAAEAAVAVAKKARQDAESKATELRDAITRRRGAFDQETRQLQSIDELLAGKPSAQESATLLMKVQKAEQDLASKRQLQKNIHLALQKAQQDHEAAQRDEQQAWNQLHAARARVAALGAPEVSETLEESWQALAAWATAASAELRARQEAAQAREQELRRQEHGLRQRQATLCAEAEVALAGESPRDAARAAHTRAEQRLQNIDERLAERTGVENDLDAKTKAAATAKLLGLHLNAAHFERWYLQEALTRLVRGATARMLDLTSGQYSLGVSANGSDFVVIDHINANEQRPVRTLSGGETFLASLSLALALGDDIASLAAKGASRLDALFLDEGFGSLDPNTLETVASTIEELGARGRMVGIVTHVQELADRVPVQFRVSKVNGSSRVERVQNL